MADLPAGLAVLGLAFGDEGKGAAVDFFCRTGPYRQVVRYNGGPQAAHHVEGLPGQQHVFAQFASGLLVPGVRGHSTGAVALEALAWEKEAQALAALDIDGPGLHTFHPESPLVTPYHQALGRLREKSRGQARHGSCGMGMGVLYAEERAGQPVLRVREIGAPYLTVRLRDLRERLRQSIPPGVAREDSDFRLFDDDALLEFYASRLISWRDRLRTRENGTEPAVIYEGAQGALLDHRHGFFPYVSPTDARAILAFPAYRLGLCRLIWTRHGPGPFPSEDALNVPPDRYNGNHPYQGPLRHGHFDLVLLRYALSYLPVDGLGLTCLDHARGLSLQVVEKYRPASGQKDLDLEDYMILDEQGSVTDLRQVAGLTARRRQTELLGQCRPVQLRWPDLYAGGQLRMSALEEITARIAHSCKRPVVFFSAGPRAADRWSAIIGSEPNSSVTFPIQY